MSAYTKLHSLLTNILTSTEMTNLRSAIAEGARGLASGKYSIDQIQRTARKICLFIRGSHIVEISELESRSGIDFVETCTDLIVTAVLEQSMMSSSRLTLSKLISGERTEESREERSSKILE